MKALRGIALGGCFRIGHNHGRQSKRNAGHFSLRSPAEVGIVKSKVHDNMPGYVFMDVTVAVRNGYNLWWQVNCYIMAYARNAAQDPNTTAVVDITDDDDENRKILMFSQLPKPAWRHYSDVVVHVCRTPQIDRRTFLIFPESRHISISSFIAIY